MPQERQPAGSKVPSMVGRRRDADVALVARVVTDEAVVCPSIVFAR